MSDVTIHIAGFGRAGYGTGPYGASPIPYLRGAVGSVSVTLGAGVSVSVTGVEATGHTTGGWGVGAFGRGGWGESYLQVDIGNTVSVTGVSTGTIGVPGTLVPAPPSSVGVIISRGTISPVAKSLSFGPGSSLP